MKYFLIYYDIGMLMSTDLWCMTENHAVKITNGISGCDKNVYTIVHELMNIKRLCTNLWY